MGKGELQILAIVDARVGAIVDGEVALPRPAPGKCARRPPAIKALMRPLKNLLNPRDPLNSGKVMQSPRQACHRFVRKIYDRYRSELTRHASAHMIFLRQMTS